MNANTQGRAVVLGPDGRLSIEQVTDHYEPDNNQALVKIEYSAINPADIRHSYMGLYGSVAGYEWTGTVVKVGSASAFTIGQALFGISMPGHNRPRHLGAHQDYIMTDGHATWELPTSLSHTAAVSMPAGVQTAIDALFNIMGFSFPLAGLAGQADPRGEPILIWGGASAVGWATIQIAKAAGFSPIFTTASQKNHDALKHLGATECFDYHDENVVANVRRAVVASGKPLAVVFDAVAVGLGVFEPETERKKSTEGCTPDLAAACCTEGAQLRLCAVLPVAHDPRWEFCLGIRTEGDSVIGIPQDPEFPRRMDTAMKWLVKNHEQYWRYLPTVTVEGADEGIKQMERVFQGKASMEKILVKHPM